MPRSHAHSRHAPAAQREHEHAHLTYHDVGSEGESYPVWLRSLEGARGCYVIRDKATKKPIYVGSSRNALYSTVTRHLQQWKRNKKWWSGGYGKGHDPGMTYQRARVQIAVVVMHGDMDHLAEEARLIHVLSPRDNLVANPDGGDEAVPF